MKLGEDVSESISSVIVTITTLGVHLRARPPNRDLEPREPRARAASLVFRLILPPPPPRTLRHLNLGSKWRHEFRGTSISTIKRPHRGAARMLSIRRLISEVDSRRRPTGSPHLIFETCTIQARSRCLPGHHHSTVRIRSVHYRPVVSLR